MEFFSHPEQRTVDHGAIAAGQVDEPGFHDEAAEFDQVPRALAAIDLPRTHIMPRFCGLIPVARRSVAQKRLPRCGQLLAHFAAPGFEETRYRAWPMPPSSRPLCLDQHDQRTRQFSGTQCVSSGRDHQFAELAHLAGFQLACLFLECL